ncbi:hypothetical protein [Aquimarina aquimarini]|uniref:hypothetical protein n=1 Tax=Aquimarina aquimarini TaxID=1191734 RepID=UPI000D55AD68|nr:hypothetical protein [Aquimarina aquimarini]
MRIENKIKYIEKEQIQFLHFPHEDVLKNKKDKHDRCRKLKRAMRLGNLEHLKVKITFADDKGLKKVETTVWGITEKSVLLKQSMIIPLERIISIN